MEKEGLDAAHNAPLSAAVMALGPTEILKISYISSVDGTAWTRFRQIWFVHF